MCAVLLRTSNRSTIHDFKLRNCLALVVLIRRRASGFSANNRQLHVFDLDSYKEEIDLAHDDVLQMVPTPASVNTPEQGRTTHFDLLYSNSMCRQSSIPTSILIELLLSGGIRNECTQVSISFTTSAILRDMVTLTKYLQIGWYGSRGHGHRDAYRSFTLIP